MSKIDYKVGDLVYRKPGTYTSVWFEMNKGPFRVTNVFPALGRVAFDTTLGGIQAKDNWDMVNFTKVNPEVPADTKGEYIIILKEDGKLKPAILPRVYTTEAQAKAVAASMAEKHPGQEFVIFKAVGKAKTNAATVEMF